MTSIPEPADAALPSAGEIADESRVVTELMDELGRVIVGQRAMLERLLIGLLADGHVLLEGVPGLAKTLAVRTLASTIAAGFHRIQFTPDLLPADLIGTMIYNQRSGDFARAEGSDLHQPAARRRDQPRARQGAERPARGDAGEAGDDRRADLPAARAVPRARHPEPDRARGDVPAARGAGRPLHVQAGRHLSRAAGGARGARPDDVRSRADGPAGARARARPSRARRLVQPGLRRRPDQGVRARPGRRDAAAARRRAWRRSRR